MIRVLYRTVLRPGGREREREENPFNKRNNFAELTTITATTTTTATGITKG